jgi:hypothetical protein
MMSIPLKSLCAPTQSEIICEQNNRKYVAKNPRRHNVRQYEPDKQLPPTTKRCDFLVLNVDDLTAYFIEIKGRDVLYALDQLDATYGLLESYLAEYSLHFRVVASKTPVGTRSHPRYVKFKRRYSDLMIKINSYVEKI